MSKYTIKFTSSISHSSKANIYVADNDINDYDTDLVLIGRGKTDYGETIWTNMIHLLENFYGPSEPSKKTLGQLWLDSNSQQLKVCVKEGTNRVFKAVGGSSDITTANTINAAKIISTDNNGGIAIPDVSTDNRAYVTRFYADNRYLQIGTTTDKTKSKAKISKFLVGYKDVDFKELDDNHFVTKSMLTANSGSTISNTDADTKLNVDPTGNGVLVYSYVKDATPATDWRTINKYFVYTTKEPNVADIQTINGSKTFTNSVVLNGKTTFTGNAKGVVDGGTPQNLVIGTKLSVAVPSVTAGKVTWKESSGNKGDILVSNGDEKTVLGGKNVFSPPEWKNIITVLTDTASKSVGVNGSFVLFYDSKNKKVDWLPFDKNVFDVNVIKQSGSGQMKLVYTGTEFKWISDIDANKATPSVNNAYLFDPSKSVEISGIIGTTAWSGTDKLELALKLPNDTNYNAAKYTADSTTVATKLSVTSLNWKTAAISASTSSQTYIDNEFKTKEFVGVALSVTRTISGQTYTATGNLYIINHKVPTSNIVNTNMANPDLSGTYCIFDSNVKPANFKEEVTVTIYDSTKTTVKFEYKSTSTTDKVILSNGIWNISAPDALTTGSYYTKVKHEIFDDTKSLGVKTSNFELLKVETISTDPGLYYIIIG